MKVRELVSVKNTPLVLISWKCQFRVRSLPKPSLIPGKFISKRTRSNSKDITNSPSLLLSSTYQKPILFPLC